MRSRIGATGVLLQIAFRNLFASRAKSLIVGGIIFAGSMIAVVGSSVVDTIDAGMRGSVQGSLGGQLQVYSARSKDDLALYGKMGGEASQLEPIEEFAVLKRALAPVANVKDVVPMGLDMAMVNSGNELDQALEKLRADVRQRGQGGGDPSLAARYESHKAHVRRMAALLQKELQEASSITEEEYLKERAQEQADLALAASDAFWSRFDADPLGNLEFLENRIAPQSLSNAFTMIRYVGTDLESYSRAFDRMRVVEGTAVPRGQRGILIGKLFAEDWLKLKAARLLDRVRDARARRDRRIARDEELQRWLKEARGQTREILMKLDPMQAEEATARLRRALASEKTDLQALLVELFTCDDSSFDRHYAIFYDSVAPLLQLYSVRVGDVITLKAASKSGYMKSVNLKVHGFVEFRGLEKATAAGWLSILDIVSWRELYGYMTSEKAAEIRAIKRDVGARDVTRENAEAELFGGGGAPAADSVRPKRIEAPTFAGASQRRAEAPPPERGYTQEEVEGGVALNAAVVLRDPARASETMRDVKAALAAAHMDMKVVTWQEAAGALGQFVSLARIILYTAVFFIFLVALVIINNATVMATLQRVKSIGTLRAIGAQKRFVVAMLLVETGAVGLAFGAAGALVGAGVVQLIRLAGGIPATNDQMYFFFSGPSLVPRLGGVSMAVSMGIVLVVSVLSGLYPAVIATRITPLEAMQSED
jgi:ABC-type lipoprotein release transport system permease subunit